MNLESTTDKAADCARHLTDHMLQSTQDAVQQTREMANESPDKAATGLREPHRDASPARRVVPPAASRFTQTLMPGRATVCSGPPMPTRVTSCGNRASPSPLPLLLARRPMGALIGYKNTATPCPCEGILAKVNTMQKPSRIC